MRHDFVNLFPSRERALPYVSIVLDDSLNAVADIQPSARLVGWQCGFEPMVVAVQSCLPGIRLDVEEAIEIAIDYLTEKRWFADDEPSEPDFVI